MKIYWSPIDALIGSAIGILGVVLIYSVHPQLHPIAYVAAWGAVASVVYQTGSELSMRRRENRPRSDD